MKLETKITLLFICILLITGSVFLIAGFSIIDLLHIRFGDSELQTYILYLLLLIGIITLIGLLIDRQIRKPLFFFIRWIDRLSKGNFKRPEQMENRSLQKMKFRPLLELTSQLDGLTEQLKRAEKEQKDLEETRKNWTAGVTHDLKTPLSYIKGYATMLRSEHTWNEEEIKEFAKIIEEKSLYMEQLIDDLSAVYEFENMQIPMQKQTMDLVSFVKKILIDLRKYPVAKNYHIRFNVNDEENILLSFDKTLLRRALENFIMNAIHHNPADTTITISISTKEDSTFIEIKDNGIGLDEQTIRQLFNQYYRGTTTDMEHLGSGLGMTIAEQFIKKQGGQVEVEGERNKGTKIKIIFSGKN